MFEACLIGQVLGYFGNKPDSGLRKPGLGPFTSSLDFLRQNQCRPVVEMVEAPSRRKWRLCVVVQYAIMCGCSVCDCVWLFSMTADGLRGLLYYVSVKLE